jgi:general secretion pathway protein G
MQLPASILLGAVVAVAYLLGSARHRGLQLTMLDVLVVVAIMAVSTALAMPLLNAAQAGASSTALQQNLRTLRSQIELYKIEHGGNAPLLYEGTFPQLTNTTNAAGVPGPPGEEYHLGPYLPGGVPANPYTGVCTVTPTDTFPPTAATGVGGWLYHQETGRIAPDLEEHLAN